ncbi:TPR repeat [Candidatus Paraburkholderia kirkii]|nr:TPR repeat [Candidatus Paraburkholderia kirkii]
MRALLGQGQMLNAIGRHTEAEAIFREAVRREPDNLRAMFGLAVTIGSQLRFEDALPCYRRALELAPDSYAVRNSNNIGFILTCLARYDEADEHLRRAIRLKPDIADANKLLGMSELRRGNYRPGWALYEFRKSGSESGGYPSLDIPEWRGEPLSGKRIVLMREQGAGDQFQFIRYASVLRAMGATVDVWASEAVASLLARADGIDRAITETPRDGYYCPVISVPHRLKDDAIPATAPYLSADASLTRAWRERLGEAAGERRRIGLVWAGNLAHHLDRFRSIPLDILLPLADIPGIAWFSLQKGPATAQLDDCAGRWPINRLDAQLDSFDATAAAIESLDLVVTIDTSVSHLAGALGNPVWVMLPAQADWRWMTGRSDNPWYPTARLFRQRATGDWSPVARCAVRSRRFDVGG